MKNSLKHLFHTTSISKANVVILVLYLWFILGTSLFLYTLSLPRSVFVVLLLVLFILLLLFSPVLLNLVRRLQLPDIAVLKQNNSLRTRREKLTCLTFFFTVSFGIFFLYYIAYYPGGFSNDSVDQYNQAVSGLYGDWHPALHTFLVFTLPLKLSGGNIACITLFQILYFSAVLTYAFYVVRNFAGRVFSLVSFFLITLNPAAGRISMYPWKDVTFAVTALWLFTFALQIAVSDGAWLHSPFHLSLFAIVWAGTSVFRHNAILLTAPLLIGIFMYGTKQHEKNAARPPLQEKTQDENEVGTRHFDGCKTFLKRRCALITCVLSVAVLFLIRGPFYAALDVQQPGGRQLETLGLPLTVICDVRSADPNALDDDTRMFTDQLADAAVWESYQLGSFGGMKWQSHHELVDTVPASKILQMMLHCFRSSPTVSVAAVIRLTDMVYTVSQGIDWAIDVPMVWPNEIGLTGTGNKTLAGILERYFSLSLILPILPFYYVGFINLILMICLLAFHKWTEKESWKRFFLAAPLFFYNFGTMLLLTNNDFRLFYYSFLVAPLILLILLTKHDDNKTAQTKNP